MRFTRTRNNAIGELCEEGGRRGGGASDAAQPGMNKSLNDAASQESTAEEVPRFLGYRPSSIISSFTTRVYDPPSAFRVRLDATQLHGEPQ